MSDGGGMMAEDGGMILLRRGFCGQVTDECLFLLLLLILLAG